MPYAQKWLWPRHLGEPSLVGYCGIWSQLRSRSGSASFQTNRCEWFPLLRCPTPVTSWHRYDVDAQPKLVVPPESNVARALGPTRQTLLRYRQLNLPNRARPLYLRADFHGDLAIRIGRQAAQPGGLRNRQECA